MKMSNRMSEEKHRTSFHIILKTIDIKTAGYPESIEEPTWQVLGVYPKTLCKQQKSNAKRESVKREWEAESSDVRLNVS